MATTSVPSFDEGALPRVPGSSATPRMFGSRRLLAGRSRSTSLRSVGFPQIAHGTVAIEVREPAGNGTSGVGGGLRTPLQLNITNGLGIDTLEGGTAWTGFDIMLAYTGLPRDQQVFHPGYAHFHNATAANFRTWQSPPRILPSPGPGAAPSGRRRRSRRTSISTVRSPSVPPGAGARRATPTW